MNTNNRICFAAWALVDRHWRPHLQPAAAAV
jgi:hypothetical protein